MADRKYPSRIFSSLKVAENGGQSCKTFKEYNNFGKGKNGELNLTSIFILLIFAIFIGLSAFAFLGIAMNYLSGWNSPPVTCKANYFNCKAREVQMNGNILFSIDQRLGDSLVLEEINCGNTPEGKVLTPIALLYINTPRNFELACYDENGKPILDGPKNVSFVLKFSFSNKTMVSQGSVLIGKAKFG